jgi:hypothetical protein
MSPSNKSELENNLPPDRGVDDKSTTWFQKRWQILVQTAAWVLSVIGGFAIPPPVDNESAGGNVWYQLAKYIVPVIVGLILVLTMRYGRPRDTMKWWIVASATLVVSVWLFFSYQARISECTTVFYGKRVVIGTERTTQGEYAWNHLASKSNKELLKHFTGQAEDAWISATVDNCRMRLAESYVWMLPVLTCCLMSSVQAVYCGSLKHSTSGRGE